MSIFAFQLFSQRNLSSMSQEEDNEMEEDEERAVEEALEEAEFMENVQAATENT